MAYIPLSAKILKKKVRLSSSSSGHRGQWQEFVSRVISVSDGDRDRRRGLKVCRQKAGGRHCSTLTGR